jgi:hypothetical protein
VAKRILVLMLLSFTGAFAQTDTPISTALKWKMFLHNTRASIKLNPCL